MSELEKKVVATYAKALEDLSDEAKTELIKLLSNTTNTDEEKKRKRFYDSFGGWSDWDKSAEEIIEKIRGARNFRDKDLSF